MSLEQQELTLCTRELIRSRLLSVTAIFFFILSYFFFNHTCTTEISTLSLHDALPISTTRAWIAPTPAFRSPRSSPCATRSEEHTSELQSRFDLVCRLLLEKKNKTVKPYSCLLTNYTSSVCGTAATCTCARATRVVDT